MTTFVASAVPTLATSRSNRMKSLTRACDWSPVLRSAIPLSAPPRARAAATWAARSASAPAASAARAASAPAAAWGPAGEAPRCGCAPTRRARTARGQSRPRRWRQSASASAGFPSTWTAAACRSPKGTAVRAPPDRVMHERSRSWPATGRAPEHDLPRPATGSRRGCGNRLPAPTRPPSAPGRADAPSASGGRPARRADPAHR